MRKKQLKRRRVKEKPLTVLFVCTANICRSPMAEGILKQVVSSNELKDMLRVESAGVAAIRGERASAFAQEVIRESGIDISDHRSQPVTERLLKNSDLVLVMTPSHKNEIHEVHPEYRGKVFLLKEYGRKRKSTTDMSIEDPYGGTKETYEVCFLRLHREIKRILPEIEALVKRNLSIT